MEPDQAPRRYSPIPFFTTVKLQIIMQTHSAIKISNSIQIAPMWQNGQHVGKASTNISASPIVKISAIVGVQCIWPENHRHWHPGPTRTYLQLIVSAAHRPREDWPACLDGKRNTHCIVSYQLSEAGPRSACQKFNQRLLKLSIAAKFSRSMDGSIYISI